MTKLRHAALEYLKRLGGGSLEIQGFRDPDTRFWAPSREERRPCCDKVETSQRWATADAAKKHCRTLTHVAALYGVSISGLRWAVAATIMDRLVSGTQSTTWPGFRSPLGPTCITCYERSGRCPMNKGQIAMPIREYGECHFAVVRRKAQRVLKNPRSGPEAIARWIALCKAEWALLQMGKTAVGHGDRGKGKLFVQAGSHDGLYHIYYMPAIEAEKVRMIVMDPPALFQVYRPGHGPSLKGGDHEAQKHG